MNEGKEVKEVNIQFVAKKDKGKEKERVVKSCDETHTLLGK